MSARKQSTKTDVIHYAHEHGGQSPTNSSAEGTSTNSPTETTSSRAATKYSAKKDANFSGDHGGELESILSFSQTFSFGDGDAGQSVSSYAETDDESISGNSLQSMSTSGEGRGSKHNGRNLALAACGEGIEMASNAFVISIVDTGRAISQKLLMTVQEREQARKEKMKQLEDAMRLKREEQLREEMRNARDDVIQVANMWRER